MEVAEFVGFIRTEIRAFEKYVREAAKEDPEQFSCFNTLDQWCREFEEYIK